MRILIRATNWLGDAVMSLPALRAIRANYPRSEITLLAKRSVSDLYLTEGSVDKVITFEGGRFQIARALRAHRFHLGILFPNSFDSALIMRLAGIPQIIGYDTDMRRMLLTHPVKTPRWKGNVHERYYYMELLQEARLIDGYHHADVPILIDRAAEAAEEGRRLFAEQSVAGPIIGVSPGAAYGSAKCWLTERFAESAAGLATQHRGTVVLFGAPGDVDYCQAVETSLKDYTVPAVNLSGKTTLGTFMNLAAACSVFLTNDSGSMHLASALGVPTVAVFGATNPKTTGPCGPVNTVIQHKVDCSPCFKRDCPIDHRCMTNVTAARVLEAASTLIRIENSAQ